MKQELMHLYEIEISDFCFAKQLIIKLVKSSVLILLHFAFIIKGKGNCIEWFNSGSTLDSSPLLPLLCNNAHPNNTKTNTMYKMANEKSTHLTGRYHHTETNFMTCIKVERKLFGRQPNFALDQWGNNFERKQMQNLFSHKASEN